MNKIGFIGGGKMATAIMKGIINSGWCESSNIFVSDKSEEALNNLKKDFNVNVSINNIDVVINSKILLFAVKPFVLKDVLKEIMLKKNIQILHWKFLKVLVTLLNQKKDILI